MASVNFFHAHDHVVVDFNGVLDWAASQELVQALDTVVGHYFYTEVEFVITSPGGKLNAFENVLDAASRLRERGVRLRTRVVSMAGSAAAVLASLGDERIADPGATLTYHGARIQSDGEISAHASAVLRSALESTDDRLIKRLVERAFAVPADPGPVASEPEPFDLKALGSLWAGLGLGAGGKGRRKSLRKVRGLFRAVRGFVDRAIAEQDRKALARLYRVLFEAELSVSAGLAVALRLIDRVGPVPPAAPCPLRPKGLTVPEWRVLYPPEGEIPREVLTRHTLVLGETGAGKTASCILPVVAAMGRTPREALGAALIIDPKRELARSLGVIAPGRLHQVFADETVLNLMAGPRWSLEDDLAAGRWLSAATRILVRAASLVPSSPARVLMDHETSDGNAEFFDREGTSLSLAVLAFVLLLTSDDLPSPESWLGDDVEAFSWVDDLLGRAKGCTGERGPNALALTAWALDGPLLLADDSSGIICSEDGSEQMERVWLFGRIAEAVAPLVGGASGEGPDLVGRILGYWTPMGRIDRQFAGVRASASCACADFATPSIAPTLYFGCEPGYESAKAMGAGLDFGRLVARRGPGTFVLFQPARDGLDNLVAIALKALFFEAVFDDPDRARGGVDLPLVGYVADEFHRFVTSDPLHGEQSFLDTCRSFGAFCVLACQSVASIEHALSHRAGGLERNRSAIDIMWNNTASKLVFRSTDPETAARVDELSPYRPGLARVVRVRPVSTLGAGECYAILADGRFERRQLEPFAGPFPKAGTPLLTYGLDGTVLERLPDGAVEYERGAR